jgi:hypothetical protein
MVNERNEKVDCFQCIHFSITWEPRRPRACKFFGFKTAGMPSVVVLNSSGSPCEGFQQKEPGKEPR